MLSHAPVYVVPALNSEGEARKPNAALDFSEIPTVRADGGFFLT